MPATTAAVAEVPREWRSKFQWKDGDEAAGARARDGKRGWATKQDAGGKAGDEAGDEMSEAGNDFGDEAELAGF